MSLIEPLFFDDAFLDNFSQLEATSETHVIIAWLGQSGYMVSHRGFRFLIDPYLSDSLTRKYADTSKPHVRISRMVIAPERLTGISFITSSHNHTDHLDGETLAALIKVNPGVKVIVPRANRAFALERLAGAGVSDAEQYLVDIHTDAPLTMSSEVGCTISAVPAAHESLDTDESGYHRYHGYCISIADKTLYHSGDCIPYKGLTDAVLPHHPDIALLPINGRDPSRGVTGNFTGPEAAHLAKSLNVRCVIPNHYDLFAFNTADPQEFVDACEAHGQTCRVLQLGEALVL